MPSADVNALQVVIRCPNCGAPPGYVVTTDGLVRCAACRAVVQIDLDGTEPVAPDMIVEGP